jgi:hypothetical protein
MESHLRDWLRATIIDFGFEESPIDPFLHTRKDETSDSIMRFETLFNRIIIQTNSKVDENDSVTRLHKLLNRLSLLKWIVIYVGNLIINILL